jgi:putative transmembrane protein Alph_Pro_TM
MKRLVIVFAVICFAGEQAGVEASSGGLVISPERVEIKTMYSGAPVRISGTAAQGSQVVVVIRGPDKEETFNKKVRAGPIWISSGQVHVSGVPSLFLSYSPVPVRSILPAEEVDRSLLDREAIRGRMHLDAGGDEIDEELIRTNYLTLKTDNQIYQVHDQTEGLVPSGQSGEFALEIYWPPTAPPASYEVAVYECRDQEIVTENTGFLVVEKVGAPAQLYEFAMNRAPVYGALAVLLAVMAGFGIDFLTAKIFGAKSKGGH